MDWASSQEPPWHLWGQQEHVVVAVTGDDSSATFAKSPQLARVTYRRPETWHWLFGVQVIKSEDASLELTELDVEFDLFVGLGRTLVELIAFERFHIEWDGLAPNTQLYSTQVIAPSRRITIDPPLVPDPANLIDQIVAENINCSARLRLKQNPPIEPPQRATVIVSAMFAPKNHVRPDWFLPNVKAAFPGAETGGK